MAEKFQTFEEQRGGPIDDPERQVFNASIVSLADGDFVIIDARGMKTLSVLAGAGATVTWIRFSTANSTDGAAITSMPVVTPPSAGAITSLDVDWPFYKISTASGPAVVGLV